MFSQIRRFYDSKYFGPTLCALLLLTCFALMLLGGFSAVAFLLVTIPAALFFATIRNGSTIQGSSGINLLFGNWSAGWLTLAAVVILAAVLIMFFPLGGGALFAMYASGILIEMLHVAAITAGVFAVVDLIRRVTVRSIEVLAADDKNKANLFSVIVAQIFSLQTLKDAVKSILSGILVGFITVLCLSFVEFPLSMIPSALSYEFGLSGFYAHTALDIMQAGIETVAFALGGYFAGSITRIVSNAAARCLSVFSSEKANATGVGAAAATMGGGTAEMAPVTAAAAATTTTTTTTTAAAAVFRFASYVFGFNSDPSEPVPSPSPSTSAH